MLDKLIGSKCVDLILIRLIKPRYNLKVLKLGKVSGLDHISHHMLKYTASTVCKPLQKLFTFSLSLTVFPDNWKTAIVYLYSKMVKSKYQQTTDQLPF
jgi:hypothetical protein